MCVNQSSTLRNLATHRIEAVISRQGISLHAKIENELINVQEAPCAELNLTRNFADLHAAVTYPGPAPAVGTEEVTGPALPGVADGSVVQHANSIRTLEPDAVVQLRGVLPGDQECIILHLQEVDIAD